jgi:hypothetical protein
MGAASPAFLREYSGQQEPKWTENTRYFAPNYLIILELQSKAIALPLASDKAIDFSRKWKV